MAGTTGLGTTYSLPNYTGELIGLTRAETPFLSAIGGLSGGKQTTSTAFEWQTYDLANPSQPSALEGATAPTAKNRVRGNVSNLVQIHQEKVSVSYSKLAAYGQKAGVNNDQPNPVQDEANWQVEQAIKQMARDVNYSFINGTYQAPSDNTTGRKTRGIISAVSTNVLDKATSTITSLSAATDTVTETSTALSNGDQIVFTDIGASTSLVLGRVYYVVSKSTNSFKVAATSGGSAITIGTATLSYRVPWTTTLSNTHVEDLIQTVWDAGGVSDIETATLVCNSVQKRAISAAYASAYGKFMETSRTVGGVAVDSIVTDFGTINVMLDRAMPQDAILCATLSECAPVFLEVPGKGHFFAEPLAKVGSSEDVQLYGEVGLEYGAESHHGILTGLNV